MRLSQFARVGVKPLVLLVALAAAQLPAAEVLPPASQRFAAADVQEEPSFQQHVLPLMGRLGCNGRACHGSFQGQGGFRLSLFGFDFEADHKALLDEKNPRVDLKNPLQSLILGKPSSDDKDEHGGGKRFAKGSWQYHVLRRWVETGAKNDTKPHAELARLEVQPAEIQFKKPGDKVQLRAVAVWSNGVQEDVTPICRFQTNDGSIAEVSVEGEVKCMGRGDTHIVVFYDNGITPVPVMLPISEPVAAKYPPLPTPTKIDELVSVKLKKLGVIPADVCTDGEFLRRVSLDITGTLPTPEEIQGFVADGSADKRARKIDELLERPAYAAWWTTKLCDITGNNSQFMASNAYREEESRQWYGWINKRVSENRPYDEIVSGIVLSTGRKAGQSYDDYCKEMQSYYRTSNKADFANHETMPHFWSRKNLRTSEEKALGFSYAFLGVRLQCAQCHKHPFDQWSKQDFDQFTAFFNGVKYGTRPDDAPRAKELKAALALDPKAANQDKELVRVLNEGKSVPFEEVYVIAAKANANSPRKDQKKGQTPARVITPKVLGGEEVLLANYDDPRKALFEWLQEDENPYFARAWVNRTWANYFNVGIVEPADDMNLANPPSNAALLDWLTREFVAHKYDMKWLHRTITNSLAYQRSWHSNETNRLDDRNFARAVPRRLPAEVVIDAIAQSTAGEKDMAAFATNVNERAIGPSSGVYQKVFGRASTYALLAFGKPARSTNCDCERSMEPSLLQTLYLRNDQEMLGTIDRSGGWINDLSKQYKAQTVAATASGKKGDAGSLADKLAKTREKKKGLDPQKNADELRTLEHREKYLTEQLAKANPAPAAAPAAPQSNSGESLFIEQQGPKLIREAYLRILSRQPTDNELHRSLDHIRETKVLTTGLRDLVWALLNTKEFIVNH